MIRLSSLGDVVLSTSVLAPLRAAGFEIDFVVKKSFAPMLEGQPGVARVFAFDKSGGEAAARQRLFAWAKEQKYAFVLDLQDSWRTWGWRKELRGLAPVYVARKERAREWLILVGRLGKWLGFGRGGRARKFRGAAGQALDRPGESNDSAVPLTSVVVTDAERARVRALLPAGDFVALLPVSAWKGKEWPYFAELAKKFNIPVVVLGGPEDSECAAVAEAARSINPASRSLHGKTNMRESAAVLAEARWVIGNDTGMVHVAEALGKDVAMIEGPTQEQMGFSPYRPGSVLVGLDLFCRPCSKSGKICWRFGTRKCLYDLLPDQVAEILRARGYPC